MIKIDVVSGFLGAGKTTFIKKMLEFYTKCGGKSVYIVNEFGQMGIDGDLINKGNYSVFELVNGCICCTLKYDFITTLENIIEDITPNRIIFEPSGVFIFDDLIQILQGEKFNNVCAVNKVITIIDAVNYLKCAQKLSFYINNQVRYSNVLVLSKVQNAQQYIDEIICDISIKNARAEVMAKAWDDLSDGDMDELLNSENTVTDIEKAKIVKVIVKVKSKSNQLHSKFDSYSFYLEKQITKEKLIKGLEAITKGECGDIIRAKGFVIADGVTYLFNVVADDYTLEEQKYAENHRMTVIGLDFDREKVGNLFC